MFDNWLRGQWNAGLLHAHRIPALFGICFLVMPLTARNAKEFVLYLSVGLALFAVGCLLSAYLYRDIRRILRQRGDIE